MNKQDRLTYDSVGVNYADMDPFKIKCQKAALETVNNLVRFPGFKELAWTRGESVYVIDVVHFLLGFVVEGLGTKNLVADIHRDRCEAFNRQLKVFAVRSFYDHIAQCNLAMAINDMATLGVSPLLSGLHCAAGHSNWFTDEERTNDFVQGNKNANQLARSTWAVGESSTLRGLVNANTAELSSAAVGIVMPKERLIMRDIEHGDVIVLFPSSGIHANGLTMAREVADKLPSGYLTNLGNGPTFGEALLKSTIIYSPIIEDALTEEIKIHYCVNITGHGWRKLMRAPEPFVYVVEKVPDPQPEFQLIQKVGNVTDSEMYGNFNMGAGYAVFLPESQVKDLIDVAVEDDVYAFKAGYIEKRGDEKKVIIEPKGLMYEAESLQVR